VQLVQRLRDQGSSVMPVLKWLDEKLAAQGSTAEEIVALEHNSQAAANVTVRNIITSMRLISTLDWNAFFENVSLVDACLRAAPQFLEMDFATRDYYRHAVEDLAAHSGRSEVELAQVAVGETVAARR